MQRSESDAPGDAANTLGDLLTLWGRRLGWTQKTWALRSGLAERTVGDYLNDRKVNLDLNSVMKLVRAVERAAGTSILTTAMTLADVHIERVAERREGQERLRLRELEAEAEMARRHRTAGRKGA
jgi:hypothetical protein